MSRAHTRVLTTLLAKGFYREHTGLLLSLFVLIFINFFYTNVLNQTHLTPEQIRETALKLVLSTITEPLGIGIFCGIFLLYTLKTQQYVAARLRAPDAQFLYYSLNALSRPRQLRAWAVAQLVMALPLVVLGSYAVVVGLAYGHWLVPLLLPGYLLALTAYCARHYVNLTNTPASQPVQSAGPTWLSAWPKPLFSLFLVEILVRKRVAYTVTKAASGASIALVFGVFPDSRADLRLLGMISLCVALTHAVLAYQASEFELTYLRFARNLPYSKAQHYGQHLALYGVLLLPEMLWLLFVATVPKALLGALLMLGVTLLFRAILYRAGQHLKPYLRIVFGLFIGFLLLDLFGLTVLLTIGSFLAAWLLLRYHRYAE